RTRYAMRRMQTIIIGIAMRGLKRSSNYGTVACPHAAASRTIAPPAPDPTILETRMHPRSAGATRRPAAVVRNKAATCAAVLALAAGGAQANDRWQTSGDVRLGYV